MRPIERRMLKLAGAGTDEVEIAWRFRRTPRNVRHVLAYAQMDRPGAAPATDGALRPIERRVLRWRDGGASLAELAPRFRRGTTYLAQVEEMARYKLAR